MDNDGTRQLLYRSNNGKGPMLARIVHDDGQTVIMERWNEKSDPKGRHITSFRLPSQFLDSPQCGWAKVMVLLT